MKRNNVAASFLENRRTRFGCYGYVPTFVVCLLRNAGAEVHFSASSCGQKTFCIEGGRGNY